MSEDFQKYLQGWTVLSVTQSNLPECRLKITLRKSSKTREVHLSTDIYGSPQVNHVIDEGEHVTFDGMISLMTDHVCDLWNRGWEDAINQVIFETFANPLTLEIGFKCPLTDTEFTSSLRSAKESSFSERLQTPESRQEFADAVWAMQGIWP